MKFTEAKLEAAIIELLEAEGYPHILGETIERQPQEVLIKADLRAFLARQYAKDKGVFYLVIDIKSSRVIQLRNSGKSCA